VAYPLAPVSLDVAGGSEQILAQLDRGLVDAGHSSVIIAAQGSQVRGELIELRGAEPSLNGADREETYARWRAAISEVVSQRQVDLIHFHSLDFHQYVPPEGPLVLVTLHLPRSFYPENIYTLNRPRTWFNCVSASQLESCPDSPLMRGKIDNGIPLDLLHVPDVPVGPHVLAVGRICPEKGFHLAVDAAEKAGVPLHLAGTLFPYPDHVRYWREVLQPRLRPPHRFLGSLTMREKGPVMAAARCLLVPSLVAETSSLVTMESMACGTPVVAFPSGALSELIEHGRSGFLVKDTSGMAEAIGKIEHLNRPDCRLAARTRFSGARMVEQYIHLYRQLQGCECRHLRACN
jgi:glycosyltransferase involved in cell wall biosynthesis